MQPAVGAEAALPEAAGFGVVEVDFAPRAAGLARGLRRGVDRQLPTLRRDEPRGSRLTANSGQADQPCFGAGGTQG